MLLTELEGREMLKKYGVKVPDGRVVKNREDAVSVCKQIGYPVVMKGISKEIVHKTDAGVVKVDINDEEECISSFFDIIKASRSYFQRNNVDGRLEGIMIEKQIKGFEFLVGGKNDDLFGKVIVFGIGGVMAELIHDVTFRLVPIKDTDIHEMLNETRARKAIFEGFRGMRININDLKDTLKKVSRMMEKESIKEMDINPLICNESGCYAADIRMVLE